MTSTTPSVTQRRRPATPQRRLGQTAAYVVLIVVAVATLLPLVYALFGSFKSLTELNGNGGRLLPIDWDFTNFSEAWRSANFSRYFLNTMFVVVGVVVLDLIGASMMGYLLARHRVPFQRFYIGLMGASLFIGVGTAMLYPRFAIAQFFGVTNLVGVVLVEVAGTSVVQTFLVMGFVAHMPIEVEEAARIDGCGLFGVYRRVALPLMRPMLATVALLSFQHGWNNFEVPYVFTLQRPELQTLVVGVYNLRSGDASGFVEYNLILAGAVLVLVPIIVVFIFLQKYFSRGLVDGALKG